MRWATTKFPWEPALQRYLHEVLINTYTYLAIVIYTKGTRWVPTDALTLAYHYVTTMVPTQVTILKCMWIEVVLQSTTKYYKGHMNIRWTWIWGKSSEPYWAGTLVYVIRMASELSWKVAETGSGVASVHWTGATIVLFGGVRFKNDLRRNGDHMPLTFSGNQ